MTLKSKAIGARTSPRTSPVIASPTAPPTNPKTRAITPITKPKIPKINPSINFTRHMLLPLYYFRSFHSNLIYVKGGEGLHPHAIKQLNVTGDFNHRHKLPDHEERVAWSTNWVTSTISTRFCPNRDPILPNICHFPLVLTG
jgi:hypothetical protein